MQKCKRSCTLARQWGPTQRKLLGHVEALHRATAAGPTAPVV